jgi:hypothetical protein
MNLFGAVKHGQYINASANFSTFFRSMLTLFRYVARMLCIVVRVLRIRM